MKGLISKKEGRKIYTEGRIEDGKGQILARAEALFLELNPENVNRFSLSPKN